MEYTSNTRFVAEEFQSDPGDQTMVKVANAVSPGMTLEICTPEEFAERYTAVDA